MAVTSALRTGHVIIPINIIFVVLVLISVGGLSKPQGQVLLEGLSKLNTFVRLIGSRTQDCLACSTVPQPISYRVHRK
jgi:hypothetical protein